MASQLDWYNTFLASKEGQRVLYELRKMVFEWYKGKTPEPEGQYVLDELMKIISEKCGINTAEAKMEMIEHEAVVASAMVDKEQQQPEKPDLLETT